MTTKKFLEVFGLATLRHLPDIEKLEEEGLLQRPQTEAALDGAFGLSGEDGSEFDDAELEDTAHGI